MHINNAARSAVRRPVRQLAMLAAGVALLMVALAWSQHGAISTYAGPLPPPNDNFANAELIPGAPFTTSQSTLDATTEAGEPLLTDSCTFGAAGIGSTVWFSFTPAKASDVTVDTIGSEVDTVLAAHTGDAVDALTLVACDDDGGDGLLSLIEFKAEAGVTYYIQAGGWAGASGELTLNLSAVNQIPSIVKAPRLANLWLCDTGAEGCLNKGSGVEGVNLPVTLIDSVSTLDPKCTGFPNFLPPEECNTQQIGSFEFEVHFDAKYVTVDVTPGWIFGCNGVGGEPAGCPPIDSDCTTAAGEGFIRFACVTKGKPDFASRGPGVLAWVHVRPTADVYKLLIPNQENGIVTELINQDCQLSDLQGHPIVTDLCDNAAITIRYLEGDVHADCVIDVLDQQQVAFRWGAQLGNLLYNPQYDLEPSFPGADGDIDAKDLQFVYGRHVDPTSTCKAPHPPQLPVDPQVKVPLVPTDGAGG